MSLECLLFPFGFCGTTEEFCGDKKVDRPSCDSSRLQHVVGYYETWASRRRCNKFWPEMIPLGIYTHIIVAFAVIDPESFEIRPSMTADLKLYKRVAYLKTVDPDLKVFIAVGGWTYNDPGPTATTFSDLAASEEKQRIFFKSLIKFMSTYNFDGVDLDWEYPVAEDRSGRPEDFANFPIFLKNLKTALRGTGGRDGLTITLPASYWYLQHFDIQKMKHVDFFNIMSYDLHGTWDQGNQWTGAFLNAHTNLTEIKNSLDLLWRNDIPPEKVVLGMAFYGRAFTVADPSCMNPGYLFASGAEAGECSNEVGILTNSEILSIITERNLTPTLDKDAAVKIATWDDQWVAYDDADTFQIKADFARSQCLGGLMAWAVSHDLSDGSFSRALGTAAQRKFVALSAHVEEDDTIKTKHGQCKWMNCGENCPAGWQLLRRSDPGKRDGEWMLDDGGCLFKDEFHRLCCPPDQEAPTCGWYTFNNGNCDGTCPDGTFEIGGTNRGCSATWSTYQAACCTTGTKSTALYEKCKWGASFLCNDYTCPAEQSNILALSVNGNGGSACGDWRTVSYQERKYCCDIGDDNMTFDDCTWEDKYSPEGYFMIPSTLGWSSFCLSNCPADKVRVAMENLGACRGKSGSRAKCCSPNYTTTKNVVDPMVAQWESDLRQWLEDPTCPNDYGLNYGDGLDFNLLRRTTMNEVSMGKSSRSIDVISPLTSYEKRDQIVMFKSNSILILLTDIIIAYRLSVMTTKVVKEVGAWNHIIGTQYPHVVTGQLIPFVMNKLDFYGDEADNLAGEIICNLERWDWTIQLSTSPSYNMTCTNLDRDAWDPEYPIDPDTYGTTENGMTQKRANQLEKRDGSPRPFIVDCGIDLVTGQRRRANGLTVRFALAAPNDCADVTIDPNAPNNVWNWVTEHILELQLIPRSIEFMVTGTLPAVQGLPTYTTNNRRLPWDVAQLLTQDYSQWAIGSTVGSGRPIDRIFNALGSTSNPLNLVNAEQHLNSMKGRIFAGKQPIGNDTWKSLNTPDPLSARAALDGLRMVIAVFEYLNGLDVNRHLLNVFSDAGREWRTFEGAVNKVNPGANYNVIALWREFIINFIGRLSEWVRTWVDGHIRELIDVWQEAYRVAPDQATRDQALAILLQLSGLQQRIARVNFDTSIFRFIVS
ncbi:hypothetical protein AJ80_00709 [Polytolypa hystricis UAMH7299]|uniref:chitinase n=1 Tax=Polytolypa hystricis (strain UAMH7299) TaxID=1447883 RepID=A0A2B7YUF5_POLH7|nr:hypothetical protein AJ80_00709 [Polytolypa hystricis UAMH7299]